MGLIEKIFGKVKQIKVAFTRWKELGGYQALFSPFGAEIYKSELVRACIRPLAEHTSKANPKSSDKYLEHLLTYRPNMYMNGKDFLAKCRNLYELKNTLFIYLQRDDRGKTIGLYPVPYEQYEAEEYKNGLYIKFFFKSDAVRSLVVPWEDLAVMRKDYLMRDIGGEDNSALRDTLELINTTNQGVANAVKSTANLRGIIKNTKSMLDNQDTKAARDRFVKDYLNLENEGGIASLDPTQEFIPIKMEPAVTNFAQMREFRENVYRYFNINDNIIMSKATEEEMEAFYSSRIEPWLIALSLELTDKIFSLRQKEYNHYIMFESSRLQYCSQKTKLSLVAMVDRGAMTPNEWRATMNMAPIAGGDEPIRRLDTAEVKPGNKEGEGDGKESEE